MNEYEIVHYPQISGLTLFFDTVDYRTPHIHPEWELLWVVDGNLRIGCEREEYKAKPGTLVLFSPRHTHRLSGEPSCTFLGLQISSRLFENACPELQEISTSELFPDRFLDEAGQRELRERLLELAECYFRQEPYYELFCQAQAALILRTLFRTLPVQKISAGEAKDLERRNARLMRLLDFVDKNYTRRLRLTEFAQLEGCSLSYLSHFVREALNQSFQEYVETVRFHAACKQMALGERRMVDIYVASGFSDYHYFSRAFQERTGMTPEEYSRKQTNLSQEQVHIHQSIHSLERFYTREKNLKFLQELRETGSITIN